MPERWRLAQVFALLTDRAILASFPWMGEAFAGGQIPPEFAAATPAAADMLQAIIAVADVRDRDADRSGAFVVFLDPTSGTPGANVLHLVLIRSGGAWLIDEAIDFSNE